MKSGQYVGSVLSTNAPWPLNCDLCISNPLIMFILSPNPSVPRSCPSVQVSAASDLPVHHEVAFVQLWPHLLGHATLTQPFRRQDGPLLRSPWQPWLLTPRLLTSTPPFPRLPPSQTPISASPVWIWTWGSSGHRMEPQPWPNPLVEDQQRKAGWFGIAKGPCSV